MNRKSETDQKEGWFKRVLKVPRTGLHATLDRLARGRVAWRNFRRRRDQIDYIIYPLSGPFPERATAPPPFYTRWLPFSLPTPPLSMQAFHAHIARLAEAENLRGVIFVIEEIGVGLAKLQSLRQGFEKLQAAGKEVIAYTKTPGQGKYYLAAAADKIWVPPGAVFRMTGLFREVQFYADALKEVGITFESFQISPYKSSLDPFSKSELSPELEEMLNWLLDEQYEMLTDGFAHGRGMEPVEMRNILDRGPFTAHEAQQLNLIDAVAYEDQFEQLLFPNETDPKTERNGPSATAEKTETDKKPKRSRIKRHKLLPWPAAARKLRTVHHPRYRKKMIGVISLEGAITMGESQNSPLPIPLPLLGRSTAGEKSVVRLLRTAEKMDNLAVLIFHVDSPGGDALASDLIHREIERISKKIPIVAYMGETAASGGYYVSAGADHIMCQPATITGSIGVLMGKPSLGGLYDKLKINTVELKRGKRAGLYFSQQPLTDTERDILFDGIKEAYKDFKWVVSRGRDIPFDALDPICLGRVWTGRQALEHKLVDSHGSFIDALQEARRLGGLPIDPDLAVPVLNIEVDKRERLIPQPFPALSATLSLLTSARDVGLSSTLRPIVATLGRPQYRLPFLFFDNLG